jgi:hypothetical protein
VLGGQEALLHRLVEERGQRVVIAVDIEHAERLAVHAELAPGVDLDQLLERPDPARQRDERVGELGHQRLALVHRGHDPQVLQPAVPDLAIDQRLRHHADHLAAGLDRRVGQHAHQPERSTPVDDPDVSPDEQPRQLARRLRVGRIGAGVGPAIDGHGAQIVHRLRP